jgi:hypothetical protein
MEQRNAEDRTVLQQAKALAEAGVEVTDGEFLARVVRRGILERVDCGRLRNCVG